MEGLGRRVIRFGTFEADPIASELRKGGRRISLQEQHRTANRWQEHVRIVALIHPSLIKDGGEDFRVQMLQVTEPSGSR